jgi:Predicted xylanase/chitin deacetylase
MKSLLIRILHVLRAEDLIKIVSDPFDLRIVCYHSVGNNHSFLPQRLYISPDNFKEQLTAIKRYFRIISFEQLEEVHTQRIPFPIIITFDDGLIDNHNVVLPILEELGIKATFNLNTLPLEDGEMLWTHNLHMLYRTCGGETLKKSLLKKGDADTRDGELGLIKYVANTYSHEELSDRLQQLNRAHQLRLDGSKLYMGPVEIKELVVRGMTLGCHGRTHSNLAHSTDIEREVVYAKELLQALSKREVATFAYPFGDADSFNEVSHEYLKKHFRNVCTTLPRINKEQGQSIYHRICSYEMPGEKLVLKLLLGI